MRGKHMGKLAPSILSADFSRLGQQVLTAEEAGADYVHVDVMDGNFVPNITVGPMIVSALRPCTKLPIDVHLMIEEPERYISDFVSAGADIICVHFEACRHIHRAVQQIKESGRLAGVALNPGTPAESLTEVLADLDQIVIMTVNPGFGGQKFIRNMLPKIARVRQMVVSNGLLANIEVDGGVTLANAKDVVAAGGDILVAGSAVFGAQAGITDAVKQFKVILT
jgi:ribulose-phosphate 3-epimerase